MYWQKAILLIFVGVFLSCARVVMPPGGPVDNTPPQIKESIPENFKTQFYDSKIVIKFDEYIAIKGFNEEFVGSPLFNEKPEQILKGKSLLLKFDKDSLAPNTTYTLDFGNSIVDFRAGNPLEHYQYVFSTGDVIDSLHISGYLYLAEDLSPQEKVWVMLYKDFNDSIFRTQKPDFIAKTSIDGFYSINNIAPGTYSMFALKDINNNYIFDLPNEQIAFLDSVFVLEIEEESHLEEPISIDSSLTKPFDSLSVSQDTAESYSHYHIYPETIDLFLFEEAFVNSYLSDYTRPKSYFLNLIFSESQDSEISFNIESANSKQWIVEPSVNKDTFNIWIIDPALANRDSLRIYLDYLKTDTNLNLVKSRDTLLFNFKKKEVFKTKKQQKQEKIDTLSIRKEYVQISGNFIKKSTLDVYKTPQFSLDFPIDSVDFSRIQFFEKVDTSFVLFETQITRDSLSTRGFEINKVLKENTEYKVYFEPDAFIDYRGFGNDTLDVTFKTTSLEKYTEIILDLKNVNEQQLIVQLFNASDNMVKEQIITEATKLTFEYLLPVKYKLKIIKDKNRNGQWDTGNYDLKLQPEEILFFDEEIETKANWSHDFIWDLGKSPQKESSKKLQLE